DKVVTTTGIVTAQNIAGTNNHGFFIQDGEGAWNGIYIYILSQEGAIMPNLGDEVIVSGTVIEYYEYTEITFPTINVISSDNTIPTPTIISTEDGNNEEWEGVLVKVQNSNTLSGPNAYNEFIINDGSADLVVDDKLFNYLPSGSDPLIVVGSTYNFTGVIDYSFDEYKLLPRFAQDIELASSVSTTWGENITAYPNPFTSTVWIDNAESASRISVVNLIGQQVISITHDGSNRAMIPTNDLPSGVYLVTIVNNQGQKAVRKMIKR
ncbi:MAG TPA: T9SS type A sorting domain-containing protein, partial [Tenuifilaceae bacterium]|nr:T9SS type A sorting domain-containing protein [Tenuifilaceae bacterium]